MEYFKCKFIKSIVKSNVALEMMLNDCSSNQLNLRFHQMSKYYKEYLDLDQQKTEKTTTIRFKHYVNFVLFSKFF